MGREALESRHIARRARRCNPSTEGAGGYEEVLFDDDLESEWRKRQVVLLSNLHHPRSLCEAEMAVSTASKNADLEVTFTTAEYSWRWEVVSPGGRLASKLLSTHLITPLISFTALSASASEPLRDMSSYTLARSADAQAKTAKRSTGRQTVGCFSKPMVSTAIQRITQVIDGEADPGKLAKSARFCVSLLVLI
ncbi:hypothetical protein FRB99_008318 [Tulasnella sp. 403]|nr:hypothetical protein FRB99_008318 [Tulasnella sp. 403]